MHKQLSINDFVGFQMYESPQPIVAKAIPPIKRPATQNGMQYQGSVIIEGSSVDFYGSVESWHKF